jgi:hypothetical protein
MATNTTIKASNQRKLIPHTVLFIPSLLYTKIAANKQASAKTIKPIKARQPIPNTVRSILFLFAKKLKLINKR